LKKRGGKKKYKELKRKEHQYTWGDQEKRSKTYKRYNKLMTKGDDDGEEDGDDE
jgi:hypothetical protein